MNKVFLTFLSMVFCFSLFGQNDLISNGKKKVQLKKNKYYEIITSIEDGGDCADCNYIMLNGEIETFSKDSIKMRLGEFYSHILIENASFSNEISSVQKSNFYTFPKSNLYSIDVFKSKKRVSSKGATNAFGAILMVTGVITTLHALGIKGKSNRNLLYYSGGGQFIGGLTLVILGSNRKQYFFKPKEKKRVWKF